MKRLLLLLGVIFAFTNIHAQFIHKIKADSVLITNDSCNAELNLENSTRHVKGFLYNKGNGRTEFRKVEKLNDSTLIIGNDTFSIISSGNNGWKLTGNNATDPAIHYIGTNDSTNWIIRTNNKIRMRVLASGNVGIGANTTSHYASNDTRLMVYNDDTLQVGQTIPRNAFFDRTNTTYNNVTLGANLRNNFLSTGYLKVDTNTTFVSNYQSNILGVFSSGGFLNKTGVPVQNINGSASAGDGISVNGNKFLIQGGDTKNINAFLSGHRYMIEVSSYGTTQSYADLVLGVTARIGAAGNAHTFTNRYGLHILPIRNGNVTNAYSIMSMGESDTAYFAGHHRSKTGFVANKLIVGDPGQGNVGTIFKVGGNHWSSALATIYKATDTLTTSNSLGNRGLLGVEEIKTAENNVISNGYRPAAVINGYIQPDVNYRITSSDPQLGKLALAIEGGFLNKSGIAATNIILPATATLAAGSVSIKSIFQGNTQNITGFYCGLKLFLERTNSAGSITDYADLVVGPTRNSSSSFVINRRRGIHIVPIAQSALAPYSIFSEGASDTAYFEGHAKIKGTLTTAGRRGAKRSINAATTLTDVDEYIFGDASGAAFTITLPSAAGRDGQLYTIKKKDNSANAITINTTSSQTIDGSTTYSLVSQWAFVTVIAEGGNWLIVNK